MANKGVLRMESRGFSRFILRKETLVVLPDLMLLGTITNIGPEGMGCQFFVSSREKDTINRDTASMLSAHIFTADIAFLLNDLPCRLTYDIIVAEDRHDFAKSITKRRCGFKFSQLTRDHKERLNHFLESQSVKKASREKGKTEPENANRFSNEKRTAIIRKEPLGLEACASWVVIPGCDNSHMAQTNDFM